jgi:hypothetical protein
MESRVTRGVDVFTGKKVLKYEAKPGMGDYLLNHANHLQKLSYKSGFLKLVHVSGEGETPFMICEDPGTVPVEEVLSKLNITQRIDLVKQLADRLKTLHAELGVLHRDLRPDQLYVCQKEDGSFELYLSDFGVAAKMGEENELECSLEDPTHARAVSHFKAVFASADVAEGLPFDVQAEIEVFSKVGAYLLTRLVPSRGVEVGLRKIKPEAKDAVEVEKVKHCLSTAAAEREDRYQNMSEFSYDMNARQPMTSEQLQALHGISDAFKIDLEIVIQHVRVLEEGEIQLAAEPLKTLRALLTGFTEDMPEETRQQQAPLLEKLDATLAKAISTLEKNEAGIIQELERIGKERDREFREEESVTAGDEIILAFLEHPSDRVKAAAAMASGLTNNYSSLIKYNEGIHKKAREVIHASAMTETPHAWHEMWAEYREWKYCKDEHLDRNDSKLYVRMLKEKIYGCMAGLINSLTMSGRIEEEDYESIYVSMEAAYQAFCEEQPDGVGQYNDRLNWGNYFGLFLNRPRSKKAQSLMIRWLKRLYEPVFNKEGAERVLTPLEEKKRDEAKYNMFYSMQSVEWDTKNLEELVNDFFGTGKSGILLAEINRQNRPLYVGHHDRSVEKQFLPLIDQWKIKKKESLKTEIQTCVENNQLTQAVDLAVDEMEFDGEFLTKLMNDVFEAAKKDPMVKSKYQLFPFKTRGRKYAIVGTHYNELLEKIFESLDKNLLRPLNEGGRLQHAQIYPGYLNELSLVLKNILTQIMSPEKSAFFRDDSSTIWRL